MRGETNSEEDYTDSENEESNDRVIDESEEEEEEPKRKQVKRGTPSKKAPEKKKTTKKTSGKKATPQKKQKYEFTKDDIATLATEGIPRYGRSFAMLQKEYFAHAKPPVSRKDIQNLIANTPTLAALSKTQHDALKASAKRSFDLAHAEKVNGTEQSKGNSAVNQTNGNREEFADQSLFTFVADSHYGWLFRTDLGDHVTPDINYETNTITWTIEKHELLPQELLNTRMAKIAEDADLPIEAKFEFSTKLPARVITHKIPPDALLCDDTGSRVEKKEHDTVVGQLVEVIIPRIKKPNNLHLKAKRFAHFTTTCNTSVPLASRSDCMDE